MKTILLALLIVSVLYLTQNREIKMLPSNAQLLGGAVSPLNGAVSGPNAYQYYRVPKADGGFDYYRQSGNDIRSTGIGDISNETGIGQDALLAGSWGGGGGTAGAAGPDNSQAISSINSAIGRLGAQQTSGNSSIDSSYQNAINQLLLGKNQGEQAYNTNKQDVATGYVGAKNTIGAQAGESLNGLLRLLGSRGAGGSSASDAARQAVARGAGLQRSDVGNTFGQNNRSLDTGWNNYLTGYNNEVSSASSQRDQAKQGLEQSINTNRASLLQTLAGLQSSSGSAQPYLDQANSILDRAASYTVAPINYQTQAYQAPSAASYTTAPNATPQFDRSAGSDYFSPFLQTLLGKKQQPSFA
jgi:hypothetical protein